MILNNYSNRSTPTSITFTPQGTRLFGEDSKNQSIQNFKTTITSFKHLLDGRAKHEQEYVSFVLSHSSKHPVSVKIQDHSYDPVQLYAMFLGNLKDQINASGVKIGKCVISVPGTYTPLEREVVIQAAAIVGLSDVEVVSEVLSSGMTYATKNHEGTDKKHVIVDIGYSQMTISLLSIGERKVVVEKSLIDDSVGGRVIDKIICENLLKKLGLNFDIASKPYQRVLKECEKFKKVLSANNVVSVNIESVSEDRDIITSIKREELEDWLSGLLGKINHNIDKFLSKSDQFDSVELIGGSSRVPIIKTLISQGFGLEISTTLNQDEAISVGNAFLSAAFTKQLDKSHYELKDFNQHIVTLRIEDTEYEVFHKNRKIPQEKFIEVEAMGDFEIDARSKHLHLGRWSITNFKQEAPALVRVSVELSINGLISITSAHQGKINTQSKFSKMFTKKSEFEPLNELKVKKHHLFKRQQFHHYLSTESRLQQIDDEDKTNKETKNQLESKIYRTRRKLTEEQLKVIGPVLDQLEDWLYEDGDEASTEEYRAKIKYIDGLL